MTDSICSTGAEKVRHQTTNAARHGLRRRLEKNLRELDMILSEKSLLDQRNLSCAPIPWFLLSNVWTSQTTRNAKKHLGPMRAEINDGQGLEINRWEELLGAAVISLKVARTMSIMQF